MRVCVLLSFFFGACYAVSDQDSTRVILDDFSENVRYLYRIAEKLCDEGKIEGSVLLDVCDSEDIALEHMHIYSVMRPQIKNEISGVSGYISEPLIRSAFRFGTLQQMKSSAGPTEISVVSCRYTDPSHYCLKYRVRESAADHYCVARIDPDTISHTYGSAHSFDFLSSDAVAAIIYNTVDSFHQVPDKACQDCFGLHLGERASLQLQSVLNPRTLPLSITTNSLDDILRSLNVAMQDGSMVPMTKAVERHEFADILRNLQVPVEDASLVTTTKGVDISKLANMLKILRVDA